MSPRVAAVALCAAALLGAVVAGPSPSDWQEGQLSRAHQCISATQTLSESQVYQNYVNSNGNCRTGDCNANLDAMADWCNGLPSTDFEWSMCHTEIKAVNQAGVYQEWEEHSCINTACSDFDRGVVRAMYLIEHDTYLQAYAETRCDWIVGKIIAFDAADLGWHLFFFALAILYAWFEKQRRWGRTSGSWPTGPGKGRGAMRTELFDCCPHKAGFSLTCLGYTFCAPVHAVMNRAELDDRHFIWQDILCERLVCTNAYWNRLAVKERLDAPSEPCKDLLIACCCVPCAVAQNTIEIERGLPPHAPSAAAGGLVAGDAEAVTGTPYAAPGGYQEGGASGGTTSL